MIRWYSAEAEGFLSPIDLLPSRLPFFISCLSIYEYVILREGEKCYSILCRVHTWSYNFDVFSIFVDEEIWKVEINKQWISGVESQARRNPVPFPIISRWEQGQIDRYRYRYRYRSISSISSVKKFRALDPVPTYAFPINPGVKTKSKLPFRAPPSPSLFLSLLGPIFKISRQVSSRGGRICSRILESTRMDENLCTPLSALPW